MGKKTKTIISEDPILKKNFKYEKRKKEKQIERQQLRMQQEREALEQDQIRKLKQSIANKFETIYHDEKKRLQGGGSVMGNQKQKTNRLSQQAAFSFMKSKMISKKLSSKEGRMGNKNNNNKISQSLDGLTFFKHSAQYILSTSTSVSVSTSLKNQSSLSSSAIPSNTPQTTIYLKHFNQNLPQHIINQIYRQSKLSTSKKLQRQIHSQIKTMFGGLKKVSQENPKTLKGAEQINNTIQIQKEEHLLHQQQEENLNQHYQQTNKNNQVITTSQTTNNLLPYCLNQELKKEKDILIGIDTFVTMPKLSNITQATLGMIIKNNNNSKSKEISTSPPTTTTLHQTQKRIINSYMDYIHVENKQETTIDQFRQVVVSHFIKHFEMCRNETKTIKVLNQDKGMQVQQPVKENQHKQQQILKSKSKGFTNCKFLILTPYFGDAKAIFELIQDEISKYYINDSSEQKINSSHSSFNKKQSKSSIKRKLTSWQVQNKDRIDNQQIQDQNDFFRVGLRIFPKKRLISYFSSFDSSDVIIASPLGLKSIISSSSSSSTTSATCSFLSSVEILYIDRASVIAMQNWDHLNNVMQNLNLMPKYQSVKNSINQIRQCHLSMKGRIFRQNIVFTEYYFPELSFLKHVQFHNYEGCLTLKHFYQPLELNNNNGRNSAILNGHHQQQQNQSIERHFYKIQLKQPKDDLQTRFDFFKRKFWESIHNNDNMNRVVIFVNSYYEYVKLKGHFQKTNASAQCICEHTKKQKIQSRVANWNNKRFRILLLTERAYFFGLCEIKKLKYVYFYSLPKNVYIYKEIVENVGFGDDNRIADSSALNHGKFQKNRNMSIYSKFDKMIIDRIVGSKKAQEMIRQYCSNVSFIV